jgi:hypothetical protein
MINECFKIIKGVPEGWELVCIDQLTCGDWYIGNDGEPWQWEADYKSNFFYCIIRKIEKTGQYRPFANAEEAEPFFDERLRKKDANNVEVHSRFRIGSINICTILIASVCYTYEEAFEKFVKSDGTPFGIEIKD